MLFPFYYAVQLTEKYFYYAVISCSYFSDV